MERCVTNMSIKICLDASQIVKLPIQETTNTLELLANCTTLGVRFGRSQSGLATILEKIAPSNVKYACRVGDECISS